MARILMAVRPGKGGAWGHTVRLATALGERGHEVAICGPHAERAAGLGVRVIDVAIPREVSIGGQGRAVLAFARAVGGFSPDLIHTHGSQASGVARLARVRHPRVPIVFSPHNFAFTNWFTSPAERRAYRGIERVLAPLTSRYIAVCEAELREVRGIGAGRRGRLVYNGITPFEPGPPGERFTALAAGGPLLAAVTELQPPKGIPTLIEAMPEILRGEPRARLLIAGDGPMRAEVEALIEDLGVGEAVVLLGSIDDVPGLLAAADVFLAPGWAESFPYANLEAMSARLPIVAADVGGVGEAIIEGRTGRLVPAQDPAALAGATLGLLGDRTAAAALGTAARALLEERFTFGEMVAGTLAVYAELGVR